MNTNHINIKQEVIEPPPAEKIHGGEMIISLSSTSGSSSDFSCSSLDDDVSLNPQNKKRRVEDVLPLGFLEPIRPDSDPNGAVSTVKEETVTNSNRVLENGVAVRKEAAANFVPGCKQFWKAGDYEGCSDGAKFVDEDMDHLRVHPKFLHSNATCHKWALGAFAELLDNALDEHMNGATYVHVDVVQNKKTKGKMVVVQDNGGGMAPDKMRKCMSLGYSAKSKIANTIGQYGNGFKTSTMRLGADVIVFSRCHGKNGERPKQSIGLLSYTFLRGTGKEDIVVPMIDFERKGNAWSKCVRSNLECWEKNLDTIIKWSPYSSEEDLLQQFEFLNEGQGTRIIIYNLWENEDGSPELDFDTDKLDIQIRGNNRDPKQIDLARKYPSCRHFLTYRHSLRTYAAILYRRIPPGFQIMLRGKEVEHYDIVADLIHPNDLVYKPAAHADSKDPNMSAKVQLGFVKDAVHHIDIQGFNVYHKNRLIKPFWRVWTAAGSNGRGVIGVLEANFVKPAHDKQGFELTAALQRLEARLKHLQKTYWSSNCHFIGYSERHPQKKAAGVSPEKEAAAASSPATPCFKDAHAPSVSSSFEDSNRARKTNLSINGMSRRNKPPELACPLNQAPADVIDIGDDVVEKPKDNVLLKLKQENNVLRLRLKNALQDAQYERDRNKSLENKLEDLKKRLVMDDQEQDRFVSAFSEERSRREREEEELRKRLRDASDTIQALLDKVKKLEGTRN